MMIRFAFKKAGKSQRGQATFEYIFLLMLVIALVLIIKKNVLDPVTQFMRQKIEQTLFQGNLHQYPVKLKK